MKFNYAERMSNLTASEIRKILKVTQRPEIISFSGGLPAPELFPVEAIKEVNFSNMPNDRIVQGIKYIGEVLKEYV